MPVVVAMARDMRAGFPNFIPAKVTTIEIPVICIPTEFAHAIYPLWTKYVRKMVFLFHSITPVKM